MSFENMYVIDVMFRMKILTIQKSLKMQAEPIQLDTLWFE